MQETIFFRSSIVSDPTENVQLPDALSSVKVVVTHDCQRGCNYCYNSLQAQHVPQDAPAVLRTLSAVLDSADRPLTVEVIGGEPLEPHALPLTTAVIEVSYQHKQCERIVLNTAIPASAALAKLAPMCDFVYLSTDISPCAQNRKRHKRRRLEETKKLLDSFGTELSTSVVLFGDETDIQLISHIDGLIDIGIKSVGFGYRTNTILSDSLMASHAAQFHLLFRLRFIKESSIRLHGAILETLELLVSGRVTAGPCECGVSSISIDPNGSLVPGICGDYRQGAAVAWPKLAQPWLARSRALHAVEPCSTCRLWSVCYGGCASRSVPNAAAPYARDATYCSLLTELARRVSSDLIAAGVPDVLHGPISRLD